MFTLYDWIAIAAAAAQIVNTWMTGSIFENFHAALDAAYAANAEPSEEDSTAGFDIELTTDEKTWQDRIVLYLPLWLVTLLRCQFCMSHHVPWILIVWFLFTSLFIAPVQFLLRLPVYSLAITRLLIAINNLLPTKHA